MTYWKKVLVINIILFSFLIFVCFISCSKAPETANENSAILNQQDSPATADNNTAEASPTDTSAEPEHNVVPLAESVVPEAIRRPQQGEAPHFPEDSIIGKLGAGEASADSYQFAQKLLQDLLREESRQETLSALPPEESERIYNIFEEINPNKVRIGGGRKEPDESVSFLLRFMGSVKWSGGELYIRQNEEVWNLEDLILDEPEEQNQTKSPYRFDFPPYERFF
jgi:hypothetical protein